MIGRERARVSAGTHRGAKRDAAARSVAFLFAVSAVATSLQGCGIRPRAAVPDANAGTIVTREEIAKSEATTMWEAVQRTVRYVRFQESGRGDPERVHRRGSSTILLSEDMPIYIDHVQVRDLGLLASLPAADIERIQVLTGVHATTYYGTNAGDGVILIHTRQPRSEPSASAPPGPKQRRGARRQCGRRPAQGPASRRRLGPARPELA